MTRPTFRTFSFLLLCLLLAGCAFYSSLTEPEKQRRAFELVTDHFTQRLRWQDYAAAAESVEAGLRQSFLDRFSKDTDLKITDVRQEGLVLDETGIRAEGELVIEYYRLPSLTVKTVRLPVVWRFFGADSESPVGWKITNIQLELP
ncbi:MAG: hypothetical protein D6794_00465 [Deltaproteobacteria bacterium]|nr:MAG: hypothetical protein D6794_00465 [Deltaproteobacteria bacterium]